MRVVSLFDASGVWSDPYREAGHDVERVDLSLGSDVMTWEPVGSADVVLAAPPCTVFAGSGAQWWPAKDASGETDIGVAMVRRTMELIHRMEPRVWALENPVGRLNQLVPELEQWGPIYFNPCDHGDPYTKKTGLWGRFCPPRLSPVAPTEGSKMHLVGPGPNRNAIRSKTPAGFARAFYQANCEGSAYL